MNSEAHSVLVVASSRGDRHALFDALDGMDAGEILSARNAAHAHALLEQAPRPTLAVLDFEHAPMASRSLCLELADVPVIGLAGARFDARHGSARFAGCKNINAWLRVPVDAAEAAARIDAVLHGGRSGVRALAAPLARSSTGVAVATLPKAGVSGATLRMLADLLQPGRDAAGLSGLSETAMRVLGMDMLVVAEPVAAGAALRELARLDAAQHPVASNLLEQPFVRRALDGDVVVGTRGLASAGTETFVQSTGCAGCAAAPLFDAHRNVIGVLACASWRVDGPSGDVLRCLLEIVAARFASSLELRAERNRGRDRVLLDGLTGLSNRVLFHDRLESTLRDARRTGEVFAVLFVDLDRFKEINDSLGHAVGDEVLVAVAERLRGAVRASDTVARYAGDEFTLILRHANGRADVARVAAKLLAGMQAPLVMENGSELHVTASIGVSVYPDDATDTDDLVKHADMAMYSAKGGGRNAVQAFGNVPEDTHRQHLEMEAQLRVAEANGELLVRYQPQIDIANGAIVAVEALVRWNHPVLGMLSPGFFIPLAEETGLILSIGEWVLRQACNDLAAWRRKLGCDIRLAVNLSALQWLQPNLVAMIQSACRDAGLEPDVLDLETPEAVMANPQEELAAAVHAAHRAGCRIVIDDAGVAEMTDDYATRLPVAAVKIDYSFVRNIGIDPGDEGVVMATLEGARANGLRTVAEGVETRRQLEYLRARGCDAAQGYLFCRPLAAGALGTLLESRRSLLARDAGDGPPMVTDSPADRAKADQA